MKNTAASAKVIRATVSNGSSAVAPIKRRSGRLLREADIVDLALARRRASAGESAARRLRATPPADVSSRVEIENVDFISSWAATRAARREPHALARGSHGRAERRDVSDLAINFPVAPVVSPCVDDDGNTVAAPLLPADVDYTAIVGGVRLPAASLTDAQLRLLQGALAPDAAAVGA